MMTPKVTVQIMPVSGWAAALPTGIGILISTPFDQSDTGFAYHAHVVDSLDEITDQHFATSAFSLTHFMQNREQEGEYRSAIKAAFERKLAQHVA